MNVKAYLENERYDLYDENGNLVMSNFKSLVHVNNWCVRNDYKLIEVFEVILTEKVESSELILEEEFF